LSPFWQKIDKSIPILIIHGGNSDLLSTATIEEMKKGREETTQHYTVENVGHAPMLFSQAEVDKVSAFLTPK
jgi:pimeloyl-ACP methyl ester carboxylesterase